jgi:hypothetical protein
VSTQVLPGLGDIPSEARLNLVIHLLRSGKIEDADSLLQDINPTTPHEYVLKVCFWLLLCCAMLRSAESSIKLGVHVQHLEHRTLQCFDMQDQSTRH